MSNGIPKYQDTKPIEEETPKYEDTEPLDVKKKDSSDLSLTGSQLTGQGNQQLSQSPSESGQAGITEPQTNGQNLLSDIPKGVVAGTNITGNVFDVSKKTKQQILSDKIAQKTKEKWGATGTFKNYPTPDEKINNLTKIKGDIDSRYKDLLGRTQDKEEINKLLTNYQKELDNAANQVGLLKKGDRYIVPPEDIDKYNQHQQDAIKELSDEEFEKNRSWLKAATYKLNAGVASIDASTASLLGLSKLSQNLTESSQYYQQLAQQHYNNLDNYIEKNDWLGATGAVANNLAETIPLLIEFAAGNKANALTEMSALLGIGEGEKKYAELKDLDISQSAKIFNSVGTALNFFALSKIGGGEVTGNINSLIKDVGENETKNILQKIVQTPLQNSIETMYKATSPALKGYTIGYTSNLANNIVEKATVNPNKDLTEGNNEAGLTWALMNKVSTLYQDVQSAKQNIQVAMGKVPKNIPLDDYARSVDMVLEKDFRTKQNEGLDESFQKPNEDRIEDIKNKIDFIIQPRVDKEKINILNNEINSELQKDYPDVNKIKDLESRMKTIEDQKNFLQTEGIDKKIDSLTKEIESISNEELPDKKKIDNLNKEITSLYQQKQSIKQKFYDETIKGIDSPLDQDIYKEEKQQASDELNLKPKEEGEAIPEYIPGDMEKVSDLTLAPKKFQYKPDSDMETGKTKGVKPEEPSETNPVSVWINPETGEKTIIEGHNRFNESKNKGTEEIPVKYIKADSEEDALAKAAYENVKKGEMTGITKIDQGYRINKTGTEFDEEGNLLNKSIYPNTIGISQASQEKRAAKFGTEAPERGKGITKEEAVQRGRDLISKGANPEKVADEFKKDGKISADALSIVRAKHEELARQTNQAVDKFGENSSEAKEAFNKENQWLKENVKPMQTEWAKIGETQQGEADIDTGTVMGLQRAFTGRTGKDFTEKQSKQAKELSDKVKSLTEERDNLQKKLTDIVNEAVKKDSKSVKSIKERSKEIADIIRKGKLSRPGVFSAATPASLVWDGAIEIAAKTIEAGGDIAQAIADGLEHIKNSEWYKNFDKKEEAEKAFTEFVNKSHDGDLFTKFVDKKDNKFTSDEVRDIWGYAKREYLDKEMSYEDMLSGVSKDLGLTSGQVRRAISQPKGVRVITDEMYKVQNRRNQAVTNAKAWVKTADTPKAIKFVKSIPGFFFGLKVFGHGTVGMITHAGLNIFKPSSWEIYWPHFFKQFKNAYGSIAEYEKSMEDLKLDPDFIFWKRAGLAVEPTKIYDDYQGLAKYMPKFLGILTQIGDKGFNTLKQYRLAMAKSIYGGLSNAEKADPNTSKEIAKIVNHSTGTTNVILPNALNVAFFAPRLEASRWARLITEPTKAIRTFTSWNKATPSEKAAAKVITKRAGEMLGTLAGLLAANQAILSLTGSKHNINFTDPTESDWMKFKAWNKTIEATGGIVSTMTFVGRLMEASLQSQKDLGMDRKRINKIERIVGNYARGKFSPFMSTVTDLATQSDFSGRPLPFSKDKPPEGETRYTWGQYLLQQQSPIPLAEAINDVIRSMKEKGLTDVQAKQIMEGIFIGTISGGTGAKVGIAPTMTAEERKATALGKLRVKTFIKNNDSNKLLKPKTVSDYTDLLHKFSQFETPTNEVKKTIDKLEKPEDIQKYLKGKKLDKDYVFLSNNSPEISSLKTVINYYKNSSLKDQKVMVKTIEKNIKNLLDTYKRNQRHSLDDQELFELDDEAKEIYQNAIKKQEGKQTKKKEVVSGLQE